MSKAKQLPQEYRERALQLLVAMFRRKKEIFRKEFPNETEELDALLQWSAKPPDPPYRRLTDLERQRRVESLEKGSRALALARGEDNKEKAIEALEDAIALIEDGKEDSVALRSKVLKLLRLATGLSLSSDGKPTEKLVGQGEVARTVTLLRGVTAAVTWDTKLVWIKVAPKELAQRRKALGLIGIGKDKAADVAENHDLYLGQGAFDA